MILHAKDGTATLSEPRDLKRLSLVVEGPRDEAVGDWGSWVDDDHVVVSTDLLVELAGEAAHDQAWLDEFDAMLAYAESKGWVDADGGVRVHVAGD